MRMGGAMRKEALLTAGKLGGAAMYRLKEVFPREQMTIAAEKAVDRLNEVLPRERMKIAAEKAVDRLNEVLPRERMKIAAEKAEEASLALQNSAGEALVWFDEVFPAETRKEKIDYWFHVALPYLITAMVVAVVLWFCRSCSKCCLGTGRGVAKMMKAPGRTSVMISRAVFESNPKGYFINLRSSP